MPVDQRAKLAAIRAFPQLVAYLRDEMDWPIAQDSFEDADDLFYDFSPKELGIDPEHAAKIEEIRRLRPLSASQPWGIFFVKFEPKRLPVVALRRILSGVARKKRASASSAERQAWAVEDLLFISNYGEGDQRQIAFAHFSQPDDERDLPTLKVLGWDNLDTALHLDAVAHELTTKLSWPADESDVQAWRKTWSGAFTLGYREPITTSKVLSERLAELAGVIRDRIRTALAIETSGGPLRSLHKAFQESLVHDLDGAGFADMYAQTIAYGLFSARIADPEKKTADDFAAHMRTNPFLRELMETFLHIGGRKGRADEPGIDFDELGVSEVVELLDDADIEAIVRDFGDRNPEDDPVIHFYEHFLDAYDRRQRISRGVFYTPRPVVAYIVRSVDERLRSQFGLSDGLADTTTWGEMARLHEWLALPDGISHDQDFVSVLDPATGTGTFLVEVIDLVHSTLRDKWRAEGHSEDRIRELWNDYVPRHLLTRLHGYELLMAPYAIAHLKIGLKLHETGYRFGSDARARVLLTNSLEPALDFSEHLSFAVPALAREAQAVNHIKATERFTVVIGNPPYSVVSENDGPWIRSLMEDYKEAVRHERNLQPLSDDYLKFIRLAHRVIEATGSGVIGYITNHTYLTGVLHRGVRQSITQSFDAIQVVDLHGSALLGLVSPEGERDENVFDIRQGVAIAILARVGRGACDHVARADLWGLRASKYRVLLEPRDRVDFVTHEVKGPEYLFGVTHVADGAFSNGPSVADLFELSTVGFVTGRDAALVAFDPDFLSPLVSDFSDPTVGADELCDRYGVADTAGWPLSRRRQQMLDAAGGLGKASLVAYRPFDNRYTLFGPLLQRPRLEVFRQLGGGNIALVTSRLVKGESPGHFFVTRLPVEKIFLSAKTSNNAFAFLLYRQEDGAQQTWTASCRPAIDDQLAKRIAGAIGRDWEPTCDSIGSGESAIGPNELLGYAYAVFHSPAYRERYREQLRTAFARLPLTDQPELFSALTRIGGELVDLHLMEAPVLGSRRAEYHGRPHPVIGTARWSDATVWFDADTRVCGESDAPRITGVPEEVWEFHIGGYQVLRKWLKDRKGRSLSADDITHYQRVVVAISETIRLMAEIDEVIEAHGGWPGAFSVRPER